VGEGEGIMRAGALLDGIVEVEVAVLFKIINGDTVCVEMPGASVLMPGVGDAAKSGLGVENIGSYVGMTGKDSADADLLRRTNSIATPTSRSIMIIASAIIRRM
jgi:hypothetical protein